MGGVGYSSLMVPRNKIYDFSTWRSTLEWKKPIETCSVHHIANNSHLHKDKYARKEKLVCHHLIDNWFSERSIFSLACFILYFRSRHSTWKLATLPYHIACKCNEDCSDYSYILKIVPFRKFKSQTGSAVAILIRYAPKCDLESISDIPIRVVCQQYILEWDLSLVSSVMLDGMFMFTGFWLNAAISSCLMLSQVWSGPEVLQVRSIEFPFFLSAFLFSISAREFLNASNSVFPWTLSRCRDKL